MNYFYFFFFLSLAIIILIKPFTQFISAWVMRSERLTVTGLLTGSLGLLCIYISLIDPFWFERMWMIVTFVLGILLLMRGFFIIFFLGVIKKMLPSLMKNYYKFSIPISMLMVFLAFMIVSTDYVGPQKDISSCESDDQIQVICNFSNSEDIVITPDKKFLFMSQMGSIAPWGENESGYFAIMDLSNNKKIIPKITLEENTWGEETCSRKDDDEYGPHGIDLVERNDGRYQIGVISHHPKESVEMFELKKNDLSWEIIWRGCVNVPDKFYFNDLSLKKDGSFYASHMYKRDITMNEWFMIALLKNNSGNIVLWENSNFTEIEGSEGSSPNGLVLDEESNILYVSYNLDDKVTIFDLSNNSKINSYFIESPDNPYIKDNSIWLTSLNFQPNDAMDCITKVNCSLPFSIHELDKKTFKLKNKYTFSKTVFGLPTVAVPINETVYMGSFHADRLGSFKIN